MASDSQAGGGGALLDRGGQPFDGAGSLPGVPAAGPIAAATFEPGDATSCFASHASLAASSLESAAHAYSVPSLHISAIEISSEPYAGASSAAAAAAAFGAFEGACSCLESHAAFPALAESICGGGGEGDGGDSGGGEGGGGDGSDEGGGNCGGGEGGGGEGGGGVGGGGALCGGPHCGGPCCDGGAFASGASIAATFEPGDATSCFASHASLALSSLKSASSSHESAAHAYSLPSLHISAIEISSAPQAGISSEAVLVDGAGLAASAGDGGGDGGVGGGGGGL
jgi:hypothetical protein